MGNKTKGDQVTYPENDLKAVMGADGQWKAASLTLAHRTPTKHPRMLGKLMIMDRWLLICFPILK